MAFRASNVVPADALRLTKQTAVQLKVNLQGFVSTLAAQSVGFPELRGIYRTLDRADNQLATLSSTPGLAEYASAQENDGTYDVIAEFQAMTAAISAAKVWLDNNTPSTATVAPASQWTDEGVTSDQFTPQQTGGLRTALQGVVDTIV